MDTDLRNRIRHRLAALQSDNGEELFEKLCAEIARRRIDANIKPSAFVAGHGDRGRDFENIPGHDPRRIGRRGRADHLAPDSKLVGACTLGRSDPPGKVRSDVETICARGPRPSVIYHFCETDFPTATQTELGAWCEREYGVTLHILTGNTLADWLCEPDLKSALQLLGVGAAPAARCVLPPVDTEGFVGREGELQRLAAALIHADGAGQGRLAGVHGPPGVGKSGLAVYFARTHLAHFPDGVVGVDLRGVDDPIDALARLVLAFGEALGADEQAQPAHQIAQQRLGHRRCLVLLDNLEHAAALKALRPGGRAAVLITCRNHDVLAQFAVPAAHRVPLHRLPRPAAVDYLRRATGDGVHADAQLDALAAALHDLPLALRIGVRRLLEDPLHAGRIERFLARLAAPTGLGELHIDGEADLALLPLFALSLEPLAEHEQRAFACLGACAGGGFGSRAAAAATGLQDPGPLLGRLARLSLLEVDQASARFRFHALVDAFARWLAGRWQLAEAAHLRHAEAMAALLREQADAAGADLAALVADQDDIRHGLEHYADTGRIDLGLLQGLTRLVEQTALGAWHSRLLARLQTRLDPDSRNWMGAVLLLQQGKRDLALGRLDDARDAFDRSLEIKQALRDERGAAMVLNSLGGVLRDLGRLDDARDAFDRSLEIKQALRDERGEAMVLNSLGGVLRDLGRLDDARDAFARSLEIEQALRNEHGEAMVLNSLGGVLRDLGRLDDARDAFARSLEIVQALRDERGEAMVLNSLGGVLRDLGRLDDARDAFARSLEIARALRDERGEAMVLNSLGGVLRDLGRLDDARDAFARSLEIGQALRDERHEAMVLNSLGGVLRDLGRLDDARDAFARSLEIGRALRNERHEAMVLNSLGWLHRESGDPVMALEALDAHRSIWNRLGLPLDDVVPKQISLLRKWARRLKDCSHSVLDYHQDIAKGRRGAGDWAGAAIHAMAVLDIDSCDEHRFANRVDLAFACFRAKRLPEAIAAYRAAMAIGPLPAVGHANLGRALHLGAADLVAAEEHLREACRLQPDNPWAPSWLGLVLADAGDLDAAEASARQALVGREQHAVLLHNLAQVLASHPDSRPDKLRAALATCELASAAADFPFTHPERLADELHRRLGDADAAC
jgi:tetratricopeptide (TPR) repeat protein